MTSERKFLNDVFGVAYPSHIKREEESASGEEDLGNKPIGGIVDGHAGNGEIIGAGVGEREAAEEGQQEVGKSRNEGRPSARQTRVRFKPIGLRLNDRDRGSDSSNHHEQEKEHLQPIAARDMIKRGGQGHKYQFGALGGVDAEGEDRREDGQAG